MNLGSNLWRIQNNYFEENRNDTGKHQTSEKVQTPIAKEEPISRIVGRSDVSAPNENLPFTATPPEQNQLMRHFLTGFDCRWAFIIR
jgi:hypothetical protein